MYTNQNALRVLLHNEHCRLILAGLILFVFGHIIVTFVILIHFVDPVYNVVRSYFGFVMIPQWA